MSRSADLSVSTPEKQTLLEAESVYERLQKLQDILEIEVEAILPIQLDDITPALARKSGFDDVDDLLATAKHGRGESIYLVHFRYVPRPKRVASRRSSG